MSISVRPYKTSTSWMVDIRLELPNGQKLRDRKVTRGMTETQARKGGSDRERHLWVTATQPKLERVAMTVAEFVPLLMSGYYEAKLCKQSTIDSFRSLLDTHVVQFVGALPLDKLTNSVVSDLQAKWTKGGYTTR